MTLFCAGSRKRRCGQRGAALLVLLLIALLGVSYVVFVGLSSVGVESERQNRTAAALAQAKEALIGFAVTYRDKHPSAGPVFDQGFGYLPCPDSDNDGDADSCGAQDVSLIGRLPWKTLGLPPPRDGSNECLWYVVSGRAKDSPKTSSYNWDTTGQLLITDAAGATLAGSTPHDKPLALIIAPGSVVGGKSRASAGSSECGGSNTASDYLEGVGALGVGDTTIVLSTADSVRNGTNNDQGLWISSKEIFDRVKKRSDFKTDIDALMNDLASYLNNLAVASLPAASAGNKGVDTVIANFIAANPSLPTVKANVLNNWRDNLLYTKPAGASSVNGTPGCVAVLLFAGERSSGQSRSTSPERGDKANYVDPANAFFPSAGAYLGNSGFDSSAPTVDVVRCITGLAPGATQVSFAADLGSFVIEGNGVTTDTTVPATPKVTMQGATGSTGGCFWQSTSIPLAGKTLRAYYAFQFANADPPGGADRGNGFTLQLVRGDLSAPSLCGTETNMGALDGSDSWGMFSFIVETDVRKDASDPNANHTAIMKNGSLVHTVTCNSSGSACKYSLADKFEESPTPLPHNQRVEIHSGCNSACTACNPASHVAPNTYARISVWVDCTGCNDVATNLDRGAQPPTIERCEKLPVEMNSVFVGLTGGFASPPAATAQNVTFSDFTLRSD